MNWLVLAEMAGGSEDGRTILNSVLGEQGGAMQRCDSSASTIRCKQAPRTACASPLRRGVRAAPAQADQGLPSIR